MTAPLGGLLGLVAAGVPITFDPKLRGMVGRWSAAGFVYDENVNAPMFMDPWGGAFPIRPRAPRWRMVVEPDFFALLGALNLAGYHRAALELPGDNLDRAH